MAVRGPRRLARAVQALAGVALVLAAAALARSAERAVEAHRVVSLNPSLTAILLDLGARAVLVGVDDFSARQHPSLDGLPRVGGLYDPSLEAVTALRPDLVVLVQGVDQRAFGERLTALGIPVLVLDPKSYDDVLGTIETLGARVGRAAEAHAKVVALRRARDDAAQATLGRPRPRTVLVLQREPLFVAGAGTFLDDMLRAAGGDNIAAALPGLYPRASLEWLVSAKPEVVLDAAADRTAAAEFWSRWPSLPAVRDGRVVPLDASVVTLPGPRLDEALRLLTAALLPPAPTPGAAQ